MACKSCYEGHMPLLCVVRLLSCMQTKQLLTAKFSLVTKYFSTKDVFIQQPCIVLNICTDIECTYHLRYQVLLKFGGTTSLSEGPGKF